MKPKTIFRAASRTVPYTQIARTMLQDRNLSMEARGLLCFVLSLPDNWTFHLTWLCRDQKLGRDKAQRLVRELITNGYCVRHQGRTDNGRMGALEYWFSDDPTMIADGSSPQPENPVAVTQDVVGPQPGLPVTVTPAPVNPPLQTKQSTAYKHSKHKTHTRARKRGTDDGPAPAEQFTQAVLAEISALGLDVAELIKRYKVRTAKTLVRDPSAYLLRMAHDTFAKSHGVTVEQAAAQASRCKTKRVAAAADATGAFSRPSDAALARVRNCASLDQILSSLAAKTFPSQAACDRYFEMAAVNARFRARDRATASQQQTNEGTHES